MQKNKIYILLCLLFTLPASVIAQSGSLTLEQCKELALQNNRSLKQQALNVEIASEQKREAFTSYFPEISATATAFKADEGLVAMQMAGVPEPMSMLSEGKIAGITAMMPIYAGGQISTGNKMAKLGKEMSEVQYELSTEELLLKTEQLYWSSIEIAEKKMTIDIADEQLQAIHKQVKDYVESGVATRNNLLNVELKINELNRQRLQLNNASDLINRSLAQCIGISADSVVITKPKSWNETDPQAYRVDVYEAVANSRQIGLLDNVVNIKEMEKRMILGKNLPSLALGGGYQYNNLGGSDSKSFVGLATVSIPITGWWGGSHRTKQAKYKIQQAQLQRDDVAEQMTLQMRQYYSSLTENYQQILLTRESIISAEENLRMNQQQYESGVSTITDLLDAQTTLQQSRNAETDALIAYQIALSRYLQLTNRYR